MVDELGAAMGLNWAFEQADLTVAQTERNTADRSAGEKARTMEPFAAVWKDS